MVNILILFIGIVGFLLVVLFVLKKILKKIGQKIYIVYNQIYRKFINFYYNTSIKKELLKEELISYYVDVISSKNSLKNFKQYEQFLTQMLGKIVLDEIKKLNILEEDLIYLKKLYNWIIILIILVIITFLMFILIYKI